MKEVSRYSGSVNESSYTMWAGVISTEEGYYIASDMIVERDGRSMNDPFLHGPYKAEHVAMERARNFIENVKTDMTALEGLERKLR